MAVLLSRSCEYALRTAVYLAGAPAGAYTTVRDVSGALRIPYPFLAKIAQALTRAGLLRTLRGPAGGVALARPPGEVPLRDVVVAIDGPAVFRECVLGLPGCGEQRPCPLHAEWAGVRARIEAMLGEATLADIARTTAANDFRLTTV
jgi:Rrf2 family protein